MRDAIRGLCSPVTYAHAGGRPFQCLLFRPGAIGDGLATPLYVELATEQGWHLPSEKAKAPRGYATVIRRPGASVTFSSLARPCLNDSVTRHHDK